MWWFTWIWCSRDPLNDCTKYWKIWRCRRQRAQLFPPSKIYNLLCPNICHSIHWLLRFFVQTNVSEVLSLATFPGKLQDWFKIKAMHFFLCHCNSISMNDNVMNDVFPSMCLFACLQLFSAWNLLICEAFSHFFSLQGQSVIFVNGVCSCFFIPFTQATTRRERSRPTRLTGTRGWRVRSCECARRSPSRSTPIWDLQPRSFAVTHTL